MTQFTLKTVFILIVVAAIVVFTAFHDWNPTPIALDGTIQNQGGPPTEASVWSHSPERSLRMDLPKVPVGPKWLRNANDPPLSAADAIRIAWEKRIAVQPEHGEYWQFQSANLCPWHAEEGYWYWEVRYTLPSSGSPYDFLAVVLMDGTAIEPVVELPE